MAPAMPYAKGGPNEPVSGKPMAGAAREGRRRRSIREAPGLGVEHLQLQPAHALLAGHLALHRDARAERHRHELLDGAVPRADAVEPRLRRRHQVVLAALLARVAQRVGPRLAGQRADLAHGHLHGARLVRRPVERDPHGLALVHGQEHPAALAPALGHAVLVVLHVAQRERAQRRRQRVLPAVVGDAQRAVEGDGQGPHLEGVAGDANVHGRGGHGGVFLSPCLTRPRSACHGCAEENFYSPGITPLSGCAKKSL
jgi:hypothetical protein